LAVGRRNPCSARAPSSWNGIWHIGSAAWPTCRKIRWGLLREDLGSAGEGGGIRLKLRLGQARITQGLLVLRVLGRSVPIVLLAHVSGATGGAGFNVAATRAPAVRRTVRVAFFSRPADVGNKGLDLESQTRNGRDTAKWWLRHRK
jgi:hypothetical protein